MPEQEFRVDLSSFNPVLFAAMRANAFWNHDGSAFGRNEDAAQDKWAYEITQMIQGYTGMGSTYSAQRAFRWMVKMLHEKATESLDPTDESKQAVWKRRYLDEASRYMEKPGSLVYFEDEYMLFSLAVALRHIADVMKPEGGWQWVYRAANLTGPGLIEQPAPAIEPWPPAGRPNVLRGL